MLTEGDFSRSLKEGKCPFCGSENIDIAISCSFYGGYVLDCEGYFDGSCAYCDPEHRESDPDVYLCGDCYKGYNLKTQKIVTDLFLYSPTPGHTFRHNIDKSKQLCAQFPEQSIIMVVSAMESYFHDKFVTIVNSNSKYKFGELFAKDQNFQNIVGLTHLRFKIKNNRLCCQIDDLDS